MSSSKIITLSSSHIFVPQFATIYNDDINNLNPHLRKNLVEQTAELGG